MNVKVLMLPETEDKPGKVEYFNNVSYWNTDGRILNIYRKEGDDHPQTATILNWSWIKEDN